MNVLYRFAVDDCFEYVSNSKLVLNLMKIDFFANVYQFSVVNKYFLNRQNIKYIIKD